MVAFVFGTFGKYLSQKFKELAATWSLFYNKRVITQSVDHMNVELSNHQLSSILLFVGLGMIGAAIALN